MNTLIKPILKDYETKRNNAILDAEIKKRNLLIANPNLSKIESELHFNSNNTSCFRCK